MDTWDYYGKHDPYYGVLTSEEFRHGRMSADARARFFKSGEEQVQIMLDRAKSSLGDLKFGVALDYGCGVGRLSRALASRFERVVSVDLSTAMLAEARRNLSDCPNVSFEHAESMNATAVDFVLSKLVFQHIEPGLGLSILTRLAARLSEDGAGVIDFPVRYTGGAIRKKLRSLRGAWPFGEPLIPMHLYAVKGIEAALRRGGVRRVHVHPLVVPRFEKAVVSFSR